jgi:hypothetical protein
MRKSKVRLGLSDKKMIDEKVAQGWAVSKIAAKVGCSVYQVNTYLAKQKVVKTVQENMPLPTKISSMIKESNSFGKFTEDNKAYIVALYREGIPPKIIGELLGLEHSYNAKYSDTGGFYEKPQLDFKDECKQAQAESKIKLIMAATTDPKPNDALRFLTANESTRNLYKAPKEEKGTIKIEFPGFSRGEPGTKEMVGIKDD